MRLNNTEGILLKSQDYREHDRRLWALTPNLGLLTGIIKGVKKATSRHTGTTEPFTHAQIHYGFAQGAEVAHIRKLDVINSFYPLRQQYPRYLMGTYLCELMLKIIIPAPEAKAYFELLQSALATLQTTPLPARLKLRFELRLIELLGMAPLWDSCLACGKGLLDQAFPTPLATPANSSTMRVDFASGGVLCENCRFASNVAFPTSLATLQYLNACSVRKVELMNRWEGKDTVQEADLVMQYFFRQVLELKLQSHALMAAHLV